MVALSVIKWFIYRKAYEVKAIPLICGELWNWLSHCLFLSHVNEYDRNAFEQWRARDKKNSQFSLSLSPFDFKVIRIVFACKQVICLAAWKIFMAITMRKGEKMKKIEQERMKEKDVFYQTRTDTQIIIEKKHSQWNVYVEKKTHGKIVIGNGGSLVVLLLLKRIYQWTLNIPIVRKE